MQDSVIMFQDIPWFSVILPGALFIAGLLLLTPYIKQKLIRSRINKHINNLGEQHLQNVLLDDGCNGKVFVEHLFLTPEGFLLLAKERRKGYIFGGEFLDKWAQVINNNTFHFPNPFYSLTHVISALNYHAPGIKISTNVLFMDDCSFPKGKPENILLIKELLKPEPEKTNHQQNGTSEKLQQGWNNLKNHIETADSTMIFNDKTKISTVRLLSSILLIGLSFCWLYFSLS